MEPQLDQTPIQPELITPKSSKTWLWILLAIIITAIVAGGGVYAWQRSIKIQAQLESQNPTTRWKTFTVTNKNGFGYELQVPNQWSKKQFTGDSKDAGEDEYRELAQSFMAGNCGNGDESDSIIVMTFISTNPTVTIEEKIVDFKKGGATFSTIKTQQGITATKLISKEGYSYVYLPTSQRIYLIIGEGGCTKDFNATFDTIVSTFKLLP